VNSRPLAWRVSIATGVLVASGHEFTQRCWGEKRRRESHVRVSLLFLPLQAVRANLRLATQAVHPGLNAGRDRQSLIGANLLAWLFRSVLPCLCGESSSAPLRVQFAAYVLSGTLSISGVAHVQAVGNQQATLCRHTLCTHEFC